MDHFTKIEAYLDGLMNNKERVEFEEELASNPSLKEEYLLQREIRTILDLRKRRLYKEELIALDQKTGIKPANLDLLFKKQAIWGLVAASVVLLAIGFWQLRPKKNPYISYFEPYPDRITQRDDTFSPLEQAMESYNEQNYRLATDQLAEIHSQEPDQLEVAFYLGISSIGAKEYDQAISTLMSIPDSSLFYQASEWYIALAYGLKGNRAQAVNVLRKIDARPKHAYATRAQELLSKLESQ